MTGLTGHLLGRSWTLFFIEMLFVGSELRDDQQIGGLSADDVRNIGQRPMTWKTR
jgi:hypothetical protein